MRVRNYQEVQAEPAEGMMEGVTVRWVISEKEGAPNFAMRVFELEPGAETPFHTHPWEHEMFVLAGKGVARTEEEEIALGEGDTVFIPPNERHQIINRGNSILRFICLIPIIKD